MRLIFPPAKKQSGFTLIELLVVIAIIALLAGLIFPAMNAVQQRAQQTKCASQLRAWGVAILGYSRENNGDVQWQDWASVDANANFYSAYFGDANVAVAGKGVRTAQEYFRWCPAMKWQSGDVSPIGYSFAHPSERASDGVSYTPSDNPYKITRADTPSQLLLLIDGNALNVQPADLDAAVKPICDGSAGATIRHSGNVNALFADGHVTSYPWEQMDQSTQPKKDMVSKWFKLN